MADTTISDLTKALQDAAYVAVGFGVIAFQKAQVRRVELEKKYNFSTESFREQLSKVEGRIEPVVEAVEASLDQLEERLPTQAREIFKTVRTTAKDAGEQFRTRLHAAA